MRSRGEALHRLSRGGEERTAPAGHVMTAIQGAASLTADNPRQQLRLKSLRPAVAAKLDELKETISAYKERGRDAALDVVRKIAALAVRCMEDHGAPPRMVLVPIS